MGILELNDLEYQILLWTPIIMFGLGIATGWTLRRYKKNGISSIQK